MKIEHTHIAASYIVVDKITYLLYKYWERYL